MNNNPFNNFWMLYREFSRQMRNNLNFQNNFAFNNMPNNNFMNNNMNFMNNNMNNMMNNNMMMNNNIMMNNNMMPMNNMINNNRNNQMMFNNCMMNNNLMNNNMNNKMMNNNIMNNNIMMNNNMNINNSINGSNNIIKRSNSFLNNNINNLINDMNNFNISENKLNCGGNINNLQRSFQGNMNLGNGPCNNINCNNNCFPQFNNNINNQNNCFSFRKFNSSNIGMNNNLMNFNNFMNNINNNSEIKFKFAFMMAQAFNIKAKPNEKLSDVIERFKNNECPNQLKQHLSIPVHGGQKINDINKTLSEIGIKNGDLILFIINKEENKGQKFENKEKKKPELTSDEIIQIKKWLEEYEAMKMISRCLNNKKDNENSNDTNFIPLDNRESVHNFLDFLKQKERIGSITVKEHKHKLVYCLTDFKWICNLCNKKNEKCNARYYCSICNFNMCDECHSKGNYIKKKVFPEGVEPSNKFVNRKKLKTDYHPHNLVYCRSSRSVIGYNGWICDNCREEFDNEIWSFFCTNCDFDLCCSCAGFK